MIGIAPLRPDGPVLPPPLRMVRALVLVVVASDLVASLLHPSPGSPAWVHYAIAIGSATAAGLALFRPGWGLVASLFLIGSVLLVDASGQEISPVVVTTVAACATARLRLVWVTIGLYLGYAAVWLFRPDQQDRALAWAATIAVAAAIGFSVRVALAHVARVEGRIHRLQRRAGQLRAAERAALAEELSGLLTAGLVDQRRELAGVRTTREPAVLAGALAAAEAGAVEKLAHLRGLVSSLRERDPDDTQPPGGQGDELMAIAEDLEDVLVGRGHPVELELPPSLAGVGESARRLLARVLREAGAELVGRVPPGEPCTITLWVTPGTIGLTLGHRRGGAEVALPAALVAAREQVLAGGGTFELGAAGRDRRLRVGVPLHTTDAVRRRARREPAPGTGRWVLAGVLIVAGVLALVPELTWPRALWALALACCGLGLGLARARYAVAGLIAVLLVGLWVVEPTVEIGRPNQAAIIALTALAVIRDARLAWVVTAGWAGYSVLWFQFDSRFVTVNLIYPCLGALLGVSAHYLLRLRHAQRTRLRTAITGHDDARGQVRRELAGELHDIVAHQLSLITMQASAHLHNRDPDALQAALDRVAALTRSAQEDLALLLRVMRTGGRPDAAAELGWLSPSRTVQAAVTTLREAGFGVRVELDPAVDAVQATTRTSVTRVVREATTNVLRHAAPASDVDVTVGIDADDVRVEISNPLPSRPRDSQFSSGLGLIGLRERARITGGELTAGASGGRWRVCARLPVCPAVDLRPPAEEPATLPR